MKNLLKMVGEHRPLKQILIKMKLTFIFLLFGLISVSASTYSQNTRLDISINDNSILELFRQIEEKSEFYFFFQKEDLEEQGNVTLNKENAKVTEILDDALDGKKLEYKIVDRYIIVRKEGQNFDETKLLLAQQKSVTGKVSDEEGLPLPGVTVLVKGTTQGTVTGGDGSYLLSDVPDDAVLIFSFVGMLPQEIPVGTQKQINVVMAMDAIGIDEVVAIGYGTMKKSNITGALTGVKSENLEERSVSTMEEALAGQMAGVRVQQSNGVPGQKAIIKIRGVNTIGSGTEPLYVVDGSTVPDLTNLNINDVESLQVLKDASSAAIYGARGSNGVILVTTKSGKSGKPQITFDSYLGMEQAEKLYDVMNKEEMVSYVTWMRNEAYRREVGGDPSTPWMERPSKYRVPQNWIDDWDNGLANLPDNDWQDEVYRNALVQSYQLSVAGGNEKTKYFISGRYYDQEGIVITTGMQRTTFRAKVDTELNKRLRVGLNIAPTFSTTNNADMTDKESVVHHTLYMNPTTNFDEQTYDTALPQWFINPIEKLNRRTEEGRSTNMSSNFYGELDLIKNMTFKSSFGMYTLDMNQKVFYPKEVENGQFDWGKYQTMKSLKWQWENTLKYKLDLEGGHNLNFLLGQSCEYSRVWNSYQFSKGFPNSAVYTLNVATEPLESTTTEYEMSLASYFGRIQYDYKDKYLLSVSSRYDGSSRFGSDVKWGLFPALSAGWKISEEAFMENVEWIDHLKLRGSFGLAGNDGIGNYRWIGTVGQSNYNFNNQLQSGYAQSGVENKDLSWEMTQSTDIGVDLWAFKNRLQFAADYYSNTTKDILMNVPIPDQSGYSSVLKNYGEVRNNGMEMELTGVILDKGLTWESSLNVSYNKNEVLKVKDPFNQNYGGIYARVEEGHPLYAFYMFKTDGLLSQADIDDPKVAKLAGTEVGGRKYVDTNNDGEINDEDRTWVGNPYPEFIYGFTNRFSYHNWDFSFMFQAQTGSDVLFMFARQIDGGNSTGTYNQLSRWAYSYRSPEEPGDGRTPYPFARNTSRWNDTDLYDASYIRLKNITLGYNIPSDFASRLGIAGARLYFSGENIFTHFFDKDFPGVTTEANTSKTGNGFGADYATYPLARKLSFGIKVNF